jgi:hypothetical protein
MKGKFAKSGMGRRRSVGGGSKGKRIPFLILAPPEGRKGASIREGGRLKNRGVKQAKEKAGLQPSALQCTINLFWTSMP